MQLALFSETVNLREDVVLSVNQKQDGVKNLENSYNN